VEDTPLESLLNEPDIAALAQLEALVEACLDRPGGGGRGDDGDVQATRLVLPLPEDRDGRARLHKAVRARFPCLRTAQESLEGGGDGDGDAPKLVVRCDDLGPHRALRALLPDPAQSLALYAFVAR
jgi:hypothetical protein